MLEMVLGDVNSWHRTYLAAKPSHVGVNVDGLACPLHHPTSCIHQTRGQGFLSCVVFSRCYSGRWLLFGGYEAPGLGYLVDC
jgi:hypothetical protein